MKNIEEGLHHKILQEITIKYNPYYRKHRWKLVEESKKQVNRIFIHKKLTVKVIMDCRTTMAHKFKTMDCRTRDHKFRTLGLKKYDVILTKEQSVLTKIMSLFEGENMQTQYKVFKLNDWLIFSWLQASNRNWWKWTQQQKYLLRNIKAKNSRTRTWL